MATPTPSIRQTRLPASRFILRLLFIYILDWVVILAAIAFAGTSTLWAKPRARPFLPDDPFISFPFQTKTLIPSILLVGLSIALPAVVILLFALSLPSRSQPYVDSFRTAEGWKRRLYSLNSAWLGLGLSIAIAMLITDGLKNVTGKPRPDMLSRCKVDASAIDSNKVGPGDLVTWDVCTSRTVARSLGDVISADDLRDGFRSFPSGHASISFAGLTYLAIFLAEFVFALPLASVAPTTPTSAPLVQRTPAATSTEQRLVENNEKNSPGDRETPLPRFPIMAVILFCGTPLLLAVYISSTRYTDYRHHPFDIIFGAALGIFAGLGGWRWYGAWCCAGGEGRVYGLVGVVHGGTWKRPRKRYLAEINPEKRVNAPNNDITLV